MPEEPVYHRVWKHQERVSRENRFVRQSVQDGFRLAGSLLLCRQVLDKRDHDYHGVEHCPYCWDPLLKQVSDSRCPHCFGTGMANGGYGDRMVVRAHIGENAQFDESVENAGLRQSQTVTLKLPSEPFFKNGDVFAEIRHSEGGVPTEIGRIFQLDGPVTRKTVQGVQSNTGTDADQSLESIVVSQEGTAKVLLDTDQKYLLSDEFWGVELVPNPSPWSDFDVDELDGLSRKARYHSPAWKLGG